MSYENEQRLMYLVDELRSVRRELSSTEELYGDTCQRLRRANEQIAAYKAVALRLGATETELTDAVAAVQGDDDEVTS